WAGRYDRDLADVFAIQSEIAKTIADQLQAKISPSEKAAIEKAPTTDLAAFDLYERAKALWADITDPLHAREKLPQAAQLLDEAVARDPQFLLAWCLLSRVHGALYWTGHDHTPARLAMANVAVQTALRLQPDAGAAHRALRMVPGVPCTRVVRALVELDWRADTNASQATLAAVIAENPSAASDVDNPDYALCERTAAAAARALMNYPRDGRTTEYGINCPRAYWEGVVAGWQGDSAKAQAAFTAARSEVENLLAKQPDFAAAISLLGVIDAGLGRKEQALQEGRRACELLPTSKDAISGVYLAVNLAQIY